ncbi:MAG: fibronectin type III domain-containing protein [Spirochaetales bacterium]|nr:fibronectin type III domain-containing protein [Spirochaetales bacterium]
MKKAKRIPCLLLLFLMFGCDFGVSREDVESNNGSIGSKIGLYDGSDLSLDNIFAINNFRLSDSSPRSLRLVWDRSDYAYKYAILRRLSSENEFLVVVDNLSNRTTSFFDDRLQRGTDYIYRIQARSSKNEILYESSDLSASTAISPIGLTGIGTTKPSINLSWKWAKSWPLASKFRVYRSINRHSDVFDIFELSFGELVVDSSDPDFHLVKFEDLIEESDAGKIYYYEVSAIVSGIESYRSNLIGSYGLNAAAPVAPSNIEVSRGLYSSKISLSWDPVEAFEGSIAAEYYQVYRKMPDSQNFEKISNFLYETSYEDFIENQGLVEYFIIPVGQDDDGKILMGAQSEVVGGWLIPVPTNLYASKLSYSSKIVLSFDGFSSLDNISKVKIYKSINFDMLDAEEIASVEPSTAEIIIEDSEISPNIDFFYAARIQSTADTDNLGKMSTIDRGKAGDLPVPVLNVTSGSSDSVTVTCLNTGIDYKSFDIYRRYEYYNPLYLPKERHVNDVDDNFPDNYDQKFYYKINPNRIKSEWIKIASDVDSVSYTDNCVINQVCGQTKARGDIEYYIVLKNYDDVPLPSPNSEIVSGFRLISDREFLEEFIAATDKLESKMTYMHMGGTSGNTSEDVTGDFSGLAQYRPKINGINSITVPIFISNYKDYYLILNDHPDGPQTTNVSWSANGVFIGGNLISGIYSGYVILDIVIANSKPIDGGYRVKNGSNPEVFITWDFNREDLNSYFNSLN